ncbi:MAG TPA: hypothetical protein VHV77_05420 [Pirellulales bacterium]|jgi:hypothetical protein|nr:hypothetical protein [Pirellulales bacterium]
MARWNDDLDLLTRRIGAVERFDGAPSAHHRARIQRRIARVVEHHIERMPEIFLQNTVAEIRDMRTVDREVGDDKRFDVNGWSVSSA